MKTIVHIILGKANPDRMNGVNKVVYQLANAQSEIGERVEVWGITRDPKSPSDYSRCYQLRLFQKKRNPFLLNSSLIRMIKEAHASTFFHLHGGFLPQMFALSQILIKSQKDFIFTPHGSYNLLALRKSYLLKKLYLFLFEKGMLKKAKYVHIIGQSEANAMEDLELKSERILIPNGQTRERTDIAKGNSASMDINFGFMGRFTVYTKGLDLLFKGFKLYREKHRGAGKLKLIGSGGEESRIKKMISDLNLTGLVILVGAKYGEEKKACLRDLTGFFHPSRNEGLPGSVLEASALGVPCVVSEATNLLSYIDDYYAGLGLKENTPECIANAMKILELLKNSGSLCFMAANAKRMIEKEFDWQVIARRFSNEVFIN